MSQPPLLLQALRREPVTRRPVWIMRQAGRYLPEYRALRGKYSFEELSGSAELATQVTLQPLARFPLDAAIIFADIMSPLPALGVDVSFAPGPVIAEPIRCLDDIERLRVPAAEELAPSVYETLRSVRREVPQHVAVLGFCGAPWTLAAYLVQGRGAKDFPALRAFAAAEPEALGRLLATLSDAMARYLTAQIAAGAQAVQIFDSWAGVLSLADWQRLIRPHLERLLATVGDAGAPRILFVQNAPHLIDAYAQLPCEALSVDWRTDIAALQRRVPQRAVQGNIDPALLLGGPEPTRRAAAALREATEQRGHIANLGHGVLPETPIASVEAFIETITEKAQAA